MTVPPYFDNGTAPQLPENQLGNPKSESPADNGAGIDRADVRRTEMRSAVQHYALQHETIRRGNTQDNNPEPLERQILHAHFGRVLHGGNCRLGWDRLRRSLGSLCALCTAGNGNG